MKTLPLTQGKVAIVDVVGYFEHSGLWRKRAVGGWITADGSWAIRGPIMAKPMYWVYRGNGRYSPTGKYDDSVSFKTVREAKKFVETFYA